MQLYLAGNQGESLANESVDSVRNIVDNSTPPPGVKAYVTGAAPLVTDQFEVGRHGTLKTTLITLGVIAVMLFSSQLKSDRAELHRRVAAAIDSSGPDSADENAALIAEHLRPQAISTPPTAGTCAPEHGRPTATSPRRELSWERARRVADALPDDDPDRSSMRIAPRTLLCANAFRVHVDISGGLFEELRQLCADAGDKASLAIGMAGLVEVHMIYGRVGEASRLASETMALVESIGDPTLTVGLSMSPIATKLQTGEIAEALRWSQTVIDLADGEPAKGQTSLSTGR